MLEKGIVFITLKFAEFPIVFNWNLFADNFSPAWVTEQRIKLKAFFMCLILMESIDRSELFYAIELKYFLSK